MPAVSEQLRAAREKSGLSVQAVAEATKIKTEQVRDLEAGEFKRFAAPVYVRGFVRTYAGLLKLDVPAIMKALETELSQIKELSAPPSLSARPKGPIDFITLQLSKVNWRVALPVAAVLLGVAGGVWAIQAWKTRQSRDPLAELKPAVYEMPPRASGETLPLSPVAPPKRP
jgi:cytoskeleton protein RodZ